MAPVSPSQPPRVLLVEPDDDGRDMYVDYLRQRGFAVAIANSTDEGLVRAASADVIVTGIRMPGPFDGLELVRRLRDDLPTRDTPIIVLTSHAFEADRQRARAAGCDVFLSKPCLPDRLASEIDIVLTRRRLPRPQPARVRRAPTRKHRVS